MKLTERVLKTSGFTNDDLIHLVSGGESWKVKFKTILTALQPIGTANQIVSTNSAGNAIENRTLRFVNTGTSPNVDYATGFINLNIADASDIVSRGFVTNGVQTFGGNKNIIGSLRIGNSAPNINDASLMVKGFGANNTTFHTRFTTSADRIIFEIDNGGRIGYNRAAPTSGNFQHQFAGQVVFDNNVLVFGGVDLAGNWDFIQGRNNSLASFIGGGGNNFHYRFQCDNRNGVGAMQAHMMLDLEHTTAGVFGDASMLRFGQTVNQAGGLTQKTLSIFSEPILTSAYNYQAFDFKTSAVYAPNAAVVNYLFSALNPNINASVNNQSIVGLDINLTGSDSSFTGVTRFGLQTNSGIKGNTLSIGTTSTLADITVIKSKALGIVGAWFENTNSDNLANAGIQLITQTGVDLRLSATNDGTSTYFGTATNHSLNFHVNGNNIARMVNNGSINIASGSKLRLGSLNTDAINIVDIKDAYDSGLRVLIENTSSNGGGFASLDLVTQIGMRTVIGSSNVGANGFAQIGTFTNHNTVLYANSIGSIFIDKVIGGIGIGADLITGNFVSVSKSISTGLNFLIENGSTNSAAATTLTLKTQTGVTTSMFSDNTATYGGVGTFSNHNFGIYTNNTLRAIFSINGRLAIGSNILTAGKLFINQDGNTLNDGLTIGNATVSLRMYGETSRFNINSGNDKGIGIYSNGDIQFTGTNYQAVGFLKTDATGNITTVSGVTGSANSSNTLTIVNGIITAIT